MAISIPRLWKWTVAVAERGLWPLAALQRCWALALAITRNFFARARACTGHRKPAGAGKASVDVGNVVDSADRVVGLVTRVLWRTRAVTAAVHWDLGGACQALVGVGLVVCSAYGAHNGRTSASSHQICGNRDCVADTSHLSLALNYSRDSAP